jgi:hypothetical protein
MDSETYSGYLARAQVAPVGRLLITVCARRQSSEANQVVRDQPVFEHAVTVTVTCERPLRIHQPAAGPATHSGTVRLKAHGHDVLPHNWRRYGWRADAVLVRELAQLTMRREHSELVCPGIPDSVGCAIVHSELNSEGAMGREMLSSDVPFKRG